MNCFTRIIARAGPMAQQQLGKQGRYKVNILTARRSTSWMTFEKPDPTAYRRIYEDADRVTQAAVYESEKTQDTLKEVLKALETATGKKAPQQNDTTAPAITPSRGQTTTRIAPRTPASIPWDSRFLSTTLIKVPGCPTTWPSEGEDNGVNEKDIALTTMPRI